MADVPPRSELNLEVACTVASAVNATDDLRIRSIAQYGTADKPLLKATKSTLIIAPGNHNLFDSLSVFTTAVYFWRCSMFAQCRWLDNGNVKWSLKFATAASPSTSIMVLFFERFRLNKSLICTNIYFRRIESKARFGVLVAVWCRHHDLSHRRRRTAQQRSRFGTHKLCCFRLSGCVNKQILS